MKYNLDKLVRTRVKLRFTLADFLMFNRASRREDAFDVALFSPDQN